jgi:NAD(P)H dehydrogenase (quinone)
LATAFAAVLGRSVEYVDIPVERWRAILSSVDGVTAYLIEHLSHVAVSHQEGEFDAVTDVVQTIGGSQPKLLEAFIRENATVFGVPQEAHRSV